VDRTFFALGCVLAFLGVGLGAFATHGLKGHISADHLDVFETGARYQMYHALALLAVAWAVTRWPATPVTAAGWLFFWGVVVFSGSLYVLAVTGQKWLGAITPLGGLALLAGWASLAWGVWRH
jgi:uncharacterized membrane protein YgdD (TMEM256/DUF423 family)